MFAIKITSHHRRIVADFSKVVCVYQVRVNGKLVATGEAR